MDRLGQLLAMVRDQPDDTFLLFALALEYRSAGDMAQSRVYFERLARDFPDYVPTYYQYGKLEEECGNSAAAIALYSMGVMKAKASGDLRTARELRQAIETVEE